MERILTNMGTITGTGNLTLSASSAFTNTTDTGKMKISGTITDNRTSGVKLANTQELFQTAVNAGKVSGVIVANDITIASDSLNVTKAFTIDLAGNTITQNTANKGLNINLAASGTVAFSGASGSKLTSNQATTLIISNGAGSGEPSETNTVVTASSNAAIENTYTTSENKAGTAVMVLNHHKFANGTSADISGIALSQITAKTGGRKVEVLNYEGNLIATSGLEVSSDTLTFKRSDSIAATVVLPTGAGSSLKYMVNGADDAYTDVLYNSTGVDVSTAASSLSYSSVEANKSAFAFIAQ